MCFIKCVDSCHSERRSLKMLTLVPLKICWSRFVWPPAVCFLLPLLCLRSFSFGPWFWPCGRCVCPILCTLFFFSPRDIDVSCWTLSCWMFRHVGLIYKIGQCPYCSTIVCGYIGTSTIWVWYASEKRTIIADCSLWSYRVLPLTPWIFEWALPPTSIFFFFLKFPPTSNWLMTWQRVIVVHRVEPVTVAKLHIGPV